MHSANVEDYMSDIFEKVSDILGKQTGFNKLQSRGTVRLILKEANLDPKVLSKDHVVRLFKEVLPRELEKRGISNAPEVARLTIADVESASFAESAYDIFSKI